MCLYVPNSWSAAASDFFVYYPETTSPVKVASLTIIGLWLSFSLVYMIGIGLGSGIAMNTLWATAFETSTGALIEAAFEPLRGFGKFCAVMVALGLISNSVPGTHSATMCAQVLGRAFKAIPRWIWGCVFIIIQLVLGLAGRNSLYTILSNFLALMGYWVEFMVLIVLMERYIFRRHFGYDWSRLDRACMPVGIASCTAFLLGWLGAVLGMYQTWYIGPLAKLANLSDVGVWVGMAFTVVSFPVLRYWEISRFGR
ncbi:hypothetical protein FJTKL_07280 [Diaporthe vaccinii]|uniref:Uncharacterized protein n=1 Tax=Diaporthe vaccinii TaxID=105482 RepID=A0ABR4EUB7_9PEZI